MKHMPRHQNGTISRRNLYEDCTSRFIPYHQSKSATTKTLRMAIARFDLREIERTSMDIDPERLDVTVTLGAKVFVLILSRDSSYYGAAKEAKWVAQRDAIRKSLENGEIYAGLTDASYETAHVSKGLRAPMPLTSHGKKQALVVGPIQNLREGSQVRQCSLHINTKSSSDCFPSTVLKTFILHHLRSKSLSFPL